MTAPPNILMFTYKDLLSSEALEGSLLGRGGNGPGVAAVSRQTFSMSILVSSRLHIEYLPLANCHPTASCPHSGSSMIYWMVTFI